MRDTTSTLLAVTICCLVSWAPAGLAQQHRATHLGNPATRFAPPLRTPDDLRARFRDPRLRPDIASILRQWGWQGDLNDLFRAAATQPITEVSLPRGTRMPFMSSRKNGRPVTLRDLLWDGKAPVSAYAFTFSSKGRNYRCVTPKPCSNFYVEDLGAPRLTLECTTPEKVFIGKPVKACFTLRNGGDAVAPAVTLSLPVPEGAQYVNSASEKRPSTRSLKWEVAGLKPGESRLLCATFRPHQPGAMPILLTGSSPLLPPLTAGCTTLVEGIPALLLEVVDLKDPIPVGGEVTYVIRVVNQGSAPGTNIRLVCTLPPSQEFVSGEGMTPLEAQPGSYSLGLVPELPPQAEKSWKLVAKAVQAGDVRFKVQLSSDQFQQPIPEEEATRQY